MRLWRAKSPSLAAQLIVLKKTWETLKSPRRSKICWSTRWTRKSSGWMNRRPCIRPSSYLRRRKRPQPGTLSKRLPSKSSESSWARKLCWRTGKRACLECSSVTRLFRPLKSSLSNAMMRFCKSSQKSLVSATRRRKSKRSRRICTTSWLSAEKRLSFWTSAWGS